MASLAGGWKVSRDMIRVCRGVIIGHVASGAGIRRVCIIALMAYNAIIGDGCMSACEWVNSGMVKVRWRPCSL